LLAIGDILAGKGDCDKAKAVWELLAREMSKAPQAATAKDRIKTLKDRCK
jgi:TolA-binding protein